MTIESIDETTLRDTETGATIHATPRRWYVAVTTGPQPTDAVRVGQGDTPEDAVADLSRTAIQSVGSARRAAPAGLEWASHQQGAGFRFAEDADGWELLDAEVIA